MGTLFKKNVKLDSSLLYSFLSSVILEMSLADFALIFLPAKPDHIKVYMLVTELTTLSLNVFLDEQHCFSDNFYSML